MIAKNLVITVSLESSIELLTKFADIILLDIVSLQKIDIVYDTVYIRSHFSNPSATPQSFRVDIEDIVSQVKRLSPNVKFIDQMDNVDDIISCEDKWLQYETFQEHMPRTELYSTSTDILNFERPVFKKRLSSRGSGVTWDIESAERESSEWIVQESLNISEELRIYIVRGEVCEFGAVRGNIAPQKVQSQTTRQLSKDEIEFSLAVSRKKPTLDFIGLDVVRTSDGNIKLLEANRSPGFTKFYKLSGIDFANQIFV